VLIGGGGAFDAVVIAGLLAVLLAEFIGETREWLQGGPTATGKAQALLKHLRSQSHQDKKNNLKNQEGGEDLGPEEKF